MLHWFLHRCYPIMDHAVGGITSLFVPTVEISNRGALLQVRNPGKVFPKALGIGVVLVVATYLLPLMIGAGISPDADADWTLGYYGHVAELVGGKWLALAVVISAAVSQIGQFEAEMSSDSYQVSYLITLHTHIP